MDGIGQRRFLKLQGEEAFISQSGDGGGVDTHGRSGRRRHGGIEGGHHDLPGGLFLRLHRAEKGDEAAVLIE